MVVTHAPAACGSRDVADRLRYMPTAAFINAINKIGIAYEELGIFP